MRTREAANEMVALALARGATIEEAAELSGVNRMTIFRRLKTPEFREQVAALKRRILEEALATLQSGATKASKKLHDLADSPDEKIALGAAKEIISLTLKARQIDGLEREVEELRTRVAMLMDTLQRVTTGMPIQLPPC